MSDLETIVRPWSAPDYAPARPYYNAGQLGVPTVKLQVGRGGQGKTFHGSISIKMTFYMTKYVVEQKSPFAGTRTNDFTGQFGQGVIGSPLGG